METALGRDVQDGFGPSVEKIRVLAKELPNKTMSLKRSTPRATHLGPNRIPVVEELACSLIAHRAMMGVALQKKPFRDMVHGA